jgi:hypothetical protein
MLKMQHFQCVLQRWYFENSTLGCCIPTGRGVLYWNAAVEFEKKNKA